MWMGMAQVYFPQTVSCRDACLARCCRAHTMPLLRASEMRDAAVPLYSVSQLLGDL